MIFLYLLQKNGNFFPIFFVSLSLTLIYKHKQPNRNIDIKNSFIGIIFALLSLNPIYCICIFLGYLASNRVFYNSKNKINLFPKRKKDIFIYGLLPALFLILLNTACMIQTNHINFSFRLNAITMGLIAGVSEEFLFRYLIFALCVSIVKDKNFSKLQNFN